MRMLIDDEVVYDGAPIPVPRGRRDVAARRGRAHRRSGHLGPGRGRWRLRDVAAGEASVRLLTPRAQPRRDDALLRARPTRVHGASCRSCPCPTFGTSPTKSPDCAGGARAVRSAISTRTARRWATRRCSTVCAPSRSPPAWTDVWICSSANGHLQATGRDARGRKQYRYHPRWRAFRDRVKFSKARAVRQLAPFRAPPGRARPAGAGPLAREGSGDGRVAARAHPDPCRQRGVRPGEQLVRAHHAPQPARAAVTRRRAPGVPRQEREGARRRSRRPPDRRASSASATSYRARCSSSTSTATASAGRCSRTTSTTTCATRPGWMPPRRTSARGAGRASRRRCWRRCLPRRASARHGRAWSRRRRRSARPSATRPPSAARRTSTRW